MPGPTYSNNSGTPVFSGSNAVTVSVPSGVSNGDLMIAQTWIQNQSAAAPTCAGWTQAFTAAGTDHQLFIFYRYASSEPANYTFTSTNATASFGWIHHLTGAVTSGNPFNVIGSASFDASGTNLVATAATTTVANTLPMCFVSHGDGSNAITGYQSGWTGVSFTGNSVFACSWITQASAGTTGSATTTFAGNDDFTGVIAAVAPAAGGSNTASICWVG